MSAYTTFLYIEINVFALAILMLIYFNMRKKAERMLPDFNLFMLLLWTDAVIIVLDTAMWVLDGKTGPMIRPVYLAVTALYYILSPFISMLWTFYADYQIYSMKSRLVKRIVPMAFPICVNAVAALFSAYGHFGSAALFVIDANNVYHRGRLFWLMAAISYFYLIYAAALVFMNRRKIPRRRCRALLFYGLPPFLGGIVQSFFYGVSLIWICSTLSVLVIFIYIQNDSLHTDYLTGLFNRRELDAYMEDVGRPGSPKRIAGIMMDLDFFKMINDRYGHLAGDEALEYTAAILKKSFGKNDFIARYGGDEFVAFFEIKEVSDLDVMIQKLKENVDKFNAQKLVPYEISLCMGYDAYDSSSGVSIRDFLSHTDKLMYEKKEGRRNSPKG